MTQIKKLGSRFDISLFLSLIRALFPHWNFFDRIAYSFYVQYRFGQENSWKKISFNQVRRFHHVFLNYETNLALAKISIIEHFARDIQELENREIGMAPSVWAGRVEELTSFCLVRDVLREEIKKELASKKDFQFNLNYRKTLFQFQVIATHLNQEVLLYTSSDIALEMK